MGYFRLRQVCLTAPHIEACTHLVQGLLGLSECHRDPGVGAYGLENLLFPMGSTSFLEIVCPNAPGTAAERFMERSGGEGGYMLIFDCDDPKARAERAQAKGVRLANHIDRENYQGYQLHPRDCRACFLEFNNTPGGEDASGPYWPAGEDWQSHVRTDVTRTFEGADVLSPDAPGLAQHWSQILDIEPRTTDGALVFDVGEQTIAVHQADGIARDRLDALRFTAADPGAMLHDARCLGLETRDDRFRLAGVWMVLRAG